MYFKTKKLKLGRPSRIYVTEAQPEISLLRRKAANRKGKRTMALDKRDILLIEAIAETISLAHKLAMNLCCIAKEDTDMPNYIGHMLHGTGVAGKTSLNQLRKAVISDSADRDANARKNERNLEKPEASAASFAISAGGDGVEKGSSR
jgi:hypothetical protein